MRIILSIALVAVSTMMNGGREGVLGSFRWAPQGEEGGAAGDETARLRGIDLHDALSQLPPENLLEAKAIKLVSDATKLIADGKSPDQVVEFLTLGKGEDDRLDVPYMYRLALSNVPPTSSGIGADRIKDAAIMINRGYSKDDIVHILSVMLGDKAAPGIVPVTAQILYEEALRTISVGLVSLSASAVDEAAHGVGGHISEADKERMHSMQHLMIEFAKTLINQQIYTWMEISTQLCEMFSISTRGAQHLLSLAIPLTDPGVTIKDDSPSRFLGLQLAYHLYMENREDIIGNKQKIYNTLRDSPLSIADTNIVWKYEVFNETVPVVMSTFTHMNEVAYIQHEKEMLVQVALSQLFSGMDPAAVTEHIREMISAKPGGSVQFPDEIMGLATIENAKRTAERIDYLVFEAGRLLDTRAPRTDEERELVEERVAHWIDANIPNSSFSREHILDDAKGNIRHLNSLGEAGPTNISERVELLTRMATSLLKGGTERALVENFIKEKVGEEWVASILTDATAMAAIL